MRLIASLVARIAGSLPHVAEAICEVVQWPSIRFVPTKTPDQQACLMLHRTRHLFIRKQTALINAIRADFAEFGIVAPVGRNGIKELRDVVAASDYGRLPMIARNVWKHSAISCKA